MTESEQDILLELANAYIEQSLNEAEATKLEAWLDRDVEARRIFLDFTHNHALLHDATVGENENAEMIELADFKPRRLPTLWQTFAAAAVVALLALVALRPAPTESSFATMAGTESARWESGSLPTVPGARLGSGSLHLIRGLATISFDSGAEVILEAPAELELIDGMNCILASGTAVAEVSEGAEGFTIQTPTANVIDHGTRFAVNVQAETGATRTHVFDGLVEVALPSSGESIELRKGEKNFVGGDGLGEVTKGGEEESWSASEAKPRKDRWTLLTTEDGKGDDTYVWTGQPNGHVSDELLLLKNSKDLKGPHRKAFLRFDLETLEPGSIREAELRLHFRPTGWGLASLVDDSKFAVYGITEEALDSWNDDSMTWQNAPANNPDNGTDLDTDSVVPLGTFTIPRGIQAGTFGVRGEELTAFLNGDQNRAATIVIVRETKESRGGGLVHGFASKRHPSLPAPTIAVR